MSHQPSALLIDAGTGNLHSVYNALVNQGFNIRVTNQPEDLEKSARVILPGVGAFGRFMAGLEMSKLVEPLRMVVRRGDPMLGICVGMQALFTLGEEMGTFPGLGLLAGKVIHFPPLGELKVPHTGWNQLWPAYASPLFDGIPSGSYAYFNHAYYCAADQPTDVLAETDYGIRYPSAVQRNSLVAVQFHPEKSQQVGQKLLANFMRM